MAEALAAPAAAGRITRWDLLLVCVSLYIASGVGRVHDLFPILRPLKPALVATLFAVGLLLLQQNGRRRVGLIELRPTRWLLGLLLWGAVSVPFALTQGIAFGDWVDFARAVIMFVVIAASVRDTRDVERLAVVYFGVTVVYTAIVLSRFQLGSGDWRLGHLYYYDANDVATLIVTALPFGLYFALAHRRLELRALAITGLLILTVGLIRSGSRGGFVAFFAIVAFVLLRFTTLPVRTRAIGLAVILVIIGATASDKYWSQMQTIMRPQTDYNLTADQGRVKIWERGIGYMMQYPATGVGMGNFQTAEGTISPLARLQERGIGVRWGAAHNTFVQVGAELGIPGLLLFLGLIISLFGSLRRVARQAARADALPGAVDLARLSQSLTTALVGFLVGGFFLSLAYADMLYTLAALTVALAKVARLSNSKLVAR